jgi:3-hydroxybutyrate dehydrogenase
MPSHSTRALEGKVAMVTGSTSGIGLGILVALAEQGAKVVMNGLGETTQIEALAQQLERKYATDIFYHGADMGRSDQIRAMIDAAGDRFGAVDILVNNAGIQHVEPIETFPEAKWDAILAINLTSSFVAIQAVFAGMKARGWGRIINVASIHGLIASPFKSAYVAAKHGMIGLTKVTALEGAEHGVTANAICPGYVWTPLVEKQIDSQAISHGINREDVIRNVFLKNQPTRKFAQTSEIGALTVFLCSPAAQSITGAALPVDGGWTAQ